MKLPEADFENTWFTALQITENSPLKQNASASSTMAGIQPILFAERLYNPNMGMGAASFWKNNLARNWWGPFSLT